MAVVAAPRPCDVPSAPVLAPAHNAALQAAAEQLAALRRRGPETPLDSCSPSIEALNRMRDWVAGIAGDSSGRNMSLSADSWLGGSPADAGVVKALEHRQATESPNYSNNPMQVVGSGRFGSICTGSQPPDEGAGPPCVSRVGDAVAGLASIGLTSPS